MNAHAGSCCRNCSHFLADVTEERKQYEPWGWCKRGAPGMWLSDPDFKWQDKTGSLCVLEIACCSDHKDQPCKKP